jgi:hypothetical protein
LDAQVSTCLVDAYEDYIVLVKLVFSSCRRFQIEQRAAIKFCSKLKKTATETFEMLKSAYGEECLSRTGVFEWHKSAKKSEIRYKTLNR